MESLLVARYTASEYPNGAYYGKPRKLGGPFKTSRSSDFEFSFYLGDIYYCLYNRTDKYFQFYEIVDKFDVDCWNVNWKCAYTLYSRDDDKIGYFLHIVSMKERTASKDIFKIDENSDPKRTVITDNGLEFTEGPDSDSSTAENTDTKMFIIIVVIVVVIVIILIFIMFFLKRRRKRHHKR